MDWVDVEHALRRMMLCESSECYAFQSMGYIYFRSCAVSHVKAPTEAGPAVMRWKFPETDIVCEIDAAYPEGVLDVVCYYEYDPVTGR